MAQCGQVFPLKSSAGGAESWAYRYRTGGRDSKRVQRGGFASRLAADQALERALQRLRQEQGLLETPTLREFVSSTSPSTTLSRRRSTSSGGCWARPPPSSASFPSVSSRPPRSRPGG